MARVSTFFVLALTIALGACDDDAGSSEACTDDCPSQDAGGQVDARVARSDAAAEPPTDAGPSKPQSDASVRDAGQDASAGSTDAALLESARQLCLDTINMYRATKSLPPMKRPSSASETCSDEGAAYDSTQNKAHGSAAKGSIPCRTSSIAQNSCPNWPVRNGSTLEKTLQQCLAQMWAEGEPPTNPCTGTCFNEHGHYLNMTSNNTTVSCGFFQNAKGEWWMNQDFTR